MEGTERPGLFGFSVRFLVASGADTNEQKNEQEQTNSLFCIFKNSGLKFNELRLLTRCASFFSKEFSRKGTGWRGTKPDGPRQSARMPHSSDVPHRVSDRSFQMEKARLRSKCSEGGRSRIGFSVICVLFSNITKTTPGCQGVAVTEQKLPAEIPGKQANFGVPCGVGR